MTSGNTWKVERGTFPSTLMASVIKVKEFEIVYMMFILFCSLLKLLKEMKKNDRDFYNSWVIFGMLLAHQFLLRKK